MTNQYLEINGWCYWFIHPNMLNRERAEHRKHEPIPDWASLFGGATYYAAWQLVRGYLA